MFVNVESVGRVGCKPGKSPPQWVCTYVPGASGSLTFGNPNGEYRPYAMIDPTNSHGDTIANSNDGYCWDGRSSNWN